MSENTEGKATLAGRLSWHVALTSAILRVAGSQASGRRLIHGFLRRVNLAEFWFTFAPTLLGRP